MLTKPFLRWAGGKSQLLPEIRKKYPVSIKKYCEPFLGGGSIAFDVVNTFKPEVIILNDRNSALINTYTQIRDNLSTIIEGLSLIQDNFFPLSLDEKKQCFLEIREKYNSKLIKNNCETAVLFIFLNKLSFNGIYRENKSGMFNTPFGMGKTPPLICDEETLITVNKTLQNTTLLSGDYNECLFFIDKDFFVYIDPPYKPISKTASWNSYTTAKFDDEEQKRLKIFIDKISEKGCKFLLSNSDPKNYEPNNDFFDKLYKGYSIERVKAKRIINCKGNNRGQINELLIYN